MNSSSIDSYLNSKAENSSAKVVEVVSFIIVIEHFSDHRADSGVTEIHLIGTSLLIQTVNDHVLLT